MSPPIQNENTTFQPCSPYGVAKLAGFWNTITYRDAYKLFATTGILFNHEGERRGMTFVTQKVVFAAVRIKLGIQKELVMGNLDAKRDWGHSKDYVKAIYAIMQHDNPDVFCVATGEHYSVRDFVITTFDRLGMDWQDYVKFDPKYLRPKEVPDLCGNPEKINKILGWKHEIGFNELVDGMIENAMENVRKEMMCYE